MIKRWPGHSRYNRQHVASGAIHITVHLRFRVLSGIKLRTEPMQIEAGMWQGREPQRDVTVVEEVEEEVGQGLAGPIQDVEPKSISRRLEFRPVSC